MRCIVALHLSVVVNQDLTNSYQLASTRCLEWRVSQLEIPPHQTCDCRRNPVVLWVAHQVRDRIQLHEGCLTSPVIYLISTISWQSETIPGSILSSQWAGKYHETSPVMTGEVWRTPRFKIFSDILTACWFSSLTPPLPVERCQLMKSRNDDKSELMTVQLTSSLGTFSDGRLAILTWGRHYQLYLATFSLNHQWTRRVKQVSKVVWIQLWIL